LRCDKRQGNRRISAELDLDGSRYALGRTLDHCAVNRTRRSETVAPEYPVAYLPSLESSSFRMTPRFAGAEDCVQGDDELSHDGGDNDFAWLAAKWRTRDP